MFAVAVAAMTALAACSSSGASGGGGSGGASTPAGSAGSTAPSSGTSVSAAAAAPTEVHGKPYPVTDYVKYVGGKAGPADKSLSPVQVGWFNSSGSGSDLGPTATIGAELAAKWINTYGGGIQGHPVKLVKCNTDGTVAGAAQCGQQLANNNAVKVIGGGAVTVGNQALESAVKPTKKPIVFSVPGSEVDVSYSPGFILFGDTLHIEGPMATFAVQDLKAKNVAIVYQNIPGNQTSANIIASGLKILGAKPKVVAFDPSSPDLTAPLTAAGAASADAIVGLVYGNFCVTLNKALKQLNIKTPVITNAPCITTDIIKGDGGVLPSWYYLVASELAGDPSDPGAVKWNETAKQLGATSQAPDPWVYTPFAGMMTVWKIYNQIGPDATSAQFTAAMTKFQGPQLFGAPDLQCGKYKNAPSVCNDTVQFYYYTGKKFKLAQWFIGPPPGLKVPNP
jgi:branched-chain amino acid transport system substrate-binding protein